MLPPSGFLRTKRKAGAGRSRLLARLLLVGKGDTVGQIVEIPVVTKSVVSVVVLGCWGSVEPKTGLRKPTIPKQGYFLQRLWG